MSVVYKQSYKPMVKSNTAILNAKHLYYIACRVGVVPNPGCGFGLWGRITDEPQASNIDNLEDTASLVREVSKNRTIYRGIVSLDEETAVAKGLNCRDEWQRLITGRVNAIAKQNDIELKDFRWCASYHHKQGHPHVHIMFWDNSDRIREEHMSPERFEIAAEKIRAAFNKDVYKEELRDLRTTQDETQKDIRARSRNLIEGFTGLTFFDEDSIEEDDFTVEFYPENLSQEKSELFSKRLERLLYLLPESGRLSYQLLKSNVKEAVDDVSRVILGETSLDSAREKLLEAVGEISATYGNSPEEIQLQKLFAEKRIYKDIGNDVLKTIKELYLTSDRSGDRRNELWQEIRQEMFIAVDHAIYKTIHSEHAVQLQSIIDAMPTRYTPMREVLKNPFIADSLRELTSICMKDEAVRRAIKISQAYYTRNKNGDEVQPSDQTEQTDEAPAAEKDTELAEPAADQPEADTAEPVIAKPETLCAGNEVEVDESTSIVQDVQAETEGTARSEPEQTEDVVQDVQSEAETVQTEPAQASETPAAEKEAEDTDKAESSKPKEDTEEFKAVAKYIFSELYRAAVLARGMESFQPWEAQRHYSNTVNFIHAFARLFSPRNSLNPKSTSWFLLLRELGRQAKKERAMERRDSSLMWDDGI